MNTSKWSSGKVLIPAGAVVAAALVGLGYAIAGSADHTECSGAGGVWVPASNFDTDGAGGACESSEKIWVVNADSDTYFDEGVCCCAGSTQCKTKEPDLVADTNDTESDWEAYASQTLTDCDDDDGSIHPGAPDGADPDSIDNDCDGVDGTDADGDGYASEATYGTDCNDGDPDIHPGAQDPADTGDVDEDCSGADTPNASEITPGDLVVTEIFEGDGSTNTTWFEVYNTTGNWIDLDTLQMTAGGTALTDISASVLVPAGGFAVIGSNSDSSSNGGVPVDHEDTALAFSGTHTLTLTGGTGTPLVDLDWSTGYPTTTSTASISLDPNPTTPEYNATDMADGTEWCAGQNTWGSTSDLGTPGNDNDECDEDEDTYQSTAAGGTDCDDTDATVHPGAGSEIPSDEVDQDCDTLELCYEDLDGDGFGTSNTVTSTNLSCADSGESTVNTDCDDTVSTGAAINPGATEIPGDSFDQNCDNVEECYQDADHDGYGSTTVIDSTTNTNCTDTGEADDNTDCDDGNDTVNPGATETVADGIDQDCSDYDSCYQDSDGDHYGTATLVEDDAAPTGTGDCDDTGESDRSDDCDDADLHTYPGAAFNEPGLGCAKDADVDGYGDENSVTPVVAGTDCDDTDINVNPSEQEICNGGIDDDCDGDVDDGDGSVTGKTRWYRDFDADSYGNSQQSVFACTASGYVADSSDCNDSNASVNPNEQEICNGGVDDDCDGLADDDDGSLDLATTGTWYEDADRDGYGDPSTSVVSCDAPLNYVADNTDCDDAKRLVNPAATEICNGGIDDDCDGDVDDADPALDLSTATDWYPDTDSDNFGDMTATAVPKCVAPAGHVDDNTDCDDTDASIHPGATEIGGDGIDQDCSGNDLCDADFDTYDSSVPSCGGTDCDDSDASIHPGVAEIWYDGIDQNCDGASDYDKDGDGYDRGTGAGDDCDDNSATVHPGQPETWYNGIDEDCDGADDYDQDGDGEDGRGHGGDDCNDTDPFINSDAGEIWYDGIDQNCDGLSDYDQDGDGYNVDSSGGLDCDDTDPAIKPGAAEIWYDVTDQNCDSHSDFDQDFDGYDSEDYGGGDCDDEDDTINPAAIEDWYNGIDQDCDGLSDFDRDGDGFDSDEHGGDDCNDLNLAINPAATENWYDGTDQNCDGHSDYDQDLDSFDAAAYGGSDCNDTDGAISPNAAEIWYDGTDQNCDGHNDYDQDFDTYRSELYGGPDCDDEVAEIHPTAAEIWYDGVDQDCDDWSDYDQDQDGYDSSRYSGTDCNDTDSGINIAATEIWYDGTDQDCDSWSDYDQDRDGFDADIEDVWAGSDCNDENPFVNPNADEVCETGPVQVDDDCDGNVNTIQGEYAHTSTELINSFGPYYLDLDGDTEGGSDSEQFYLCSVAAEENPDQFQDSNTDCDDGNIQIRAGAEERCNFADDNCNDVIDEPQSGAEPVGCDYFYLDSDRDGYGDDGEDALKLCVCQAYATADTAGDCTVATSFDAVDFDDECWADNDNDCNDANFSIKPADTEGDQVEYIDGIDNDCDRKIPLVELDCDNDGAYPMLPITPADTADGFVNHLDIGLADCQDAGTRMPAVSCFGQVVPLSCNPLTGLWMVDTNTLTDFGVFEHGLRIGQLEDQCDGWDCDDLCSDRCEGNREQCDGIDNDCNNAADLLASLTDTNGVPDVMERGVADAGYVVEEELDRDGDGHLTCDGNVGSIQTAITSASCDQLTLFGDCNDLCALSSPDAAEERCNGFVTADTCGESEGTDPDSDQHRTCGAWGTEEGKALSEDIYVLVYVDGYLSAEEEEDTGDLTGSSVQVVPLISPRSSAPECDDTLSEALETIDALYLEGSLPREAMLRKCIAADTCHRIADEGHESFWPDDCTGLEEARCGVVRLTLTEAADNTLYDQAEAGLLPGCMDDVVSFPEQAITRTVWRHDRIVEARRLVTEWECYRTYGTFGCEDQAPEGWVSPYANLVAPPGGYVRTDLSRRDLSADTRWWKELARYNPEPVIEGALTGCWGDPQGGIDALHDFDLTGGDCDTEHAGANRDRAEGPRDLVGRYLEEDMDCRTCLDGIDNNCNGLIDCADPACAECFVGQGVGCGGGSDTPCTQSGCETTGLQAASRYSTWWALVLFALAAVGLRRRERR